MVTISISLNVQPGVSACGQWSMGGTQEALTSGQLIFVGNRTVCTRRILEMSESHRLFFFLTTPANLKEKKIPLNRILKHFLL